MQVSHFLNCIFNENFYFFRPCKKSSYGKANSSDRRWEFRNNDFGEAAMFQRWGHLHMRTLCAIDQGYRDRPRLCWVPGWKPCNSSELVQSRGKIKLKYLRGGFFLVPHDRRPCSRYNNWDGIAFQHRLTVSVTRELPLTMTAPWCYSTFSADLWVLSSNGPWRLDPSKCRC